MKKNIFLLFGLGLASLLVAVPFAMAQNYGLDATAGAAGLGTDGDVPTIIGNIIGAGLALISVLFFIMVIIGGIMWMIARGNDEKSRKALDTIIAAIIGIIIVSAAYAITTFVFKSTGVSIGSGSTTTETPAPTIKQDSQCVAKGAGWACKQIDTCNDIDPFATIEEKQDDCDVNDDCELNLCPSGAKEIVCCK